MLVVWFNGGFANQMMQYTYYSYLKSNRSDVSIDMSDMRDFKGDRITDYFKTIDNYSFEDVKLNFSESLLTKLLFRINTSLNARLGFQFVINGNKVMEYNNQEKNYNFIAKKNLYLKGYWNQQDYFFKNRDEIKSLFQFVYEDYNLYPLLNYYIELLRSDRTLTIHIRGGDYITKNWFLGKNYYINSINWFKRKMEFDNILVFTNDLMFTKEILKGQNYMVIELSKIYGNPVDMYLMTNAKNLIISNSGFSWWAAYLSEINNNVVGPKKWINLKCGFCLNKVQHYGPPMSKKWKLIE